MTNRTKRFTMAALVALFAAALALGIAACTKPTFSVTFDANGGTFDGGQPTLIVEGTAGDDFSLPAEPSLPGSFFLGWSATRGGEVGAVPTTIPGQNVTYYAVWTNSNLVHMLTLTYGIEDGAIDAQTKTFPLIAGTSLAASLASVDASSGDADITFDGWYQGEVKTADGATMPAADLTLRARYTVNYTMTTYLQNADGATYGSSTSATDKGFFGEPFTCPVPTGFEIDRGHTGSSFETQRLGKGENFTVYAARRRFDVPITVGGGTSGVSEVRYAVSTYYGAELTLPAYPETPLYARLPENVYVYSWLANGKSCAPGEKVTVGSDAPITGEITFGKADLFGGQDYLFVHEGEIFLRRGTRYRKGVLDAATSVFRFEEDGKEILGGVVFAESFYYYNDTAAKEFGAYDGSDAVITFGTDHGDATYTPAKGADAVSGKISVDGKTGRYFFTPNGGGTPTEFVIDENKDGEPCFRLENPEDKGTFARLENLGDEDSYGYTVLEFDGFGFVTEHYDPALKDSPNSYEQQYFNTHDGAVGRYVRLTDWSEDELIYTLSFSDGDSYTVKLTARDDLMDLSSYRLDGIWYAYDGLLEEGMLIGGNRAAGFMLGYDANEATLVLDGFGRAIYDPSARYTEDTAYEDLVWTGTYVMREELVYGFSNSTATNGFDFSASYLWWVEYTDSETGDVSYFDIGSEHTYTVRKNFPKQYHVLGTDLEYFGASAVMNYYYGTVGQRFTDVMFWDVHGDRTEFWIYGRSSGDIWTQVIAGEAQPFWEPLATGAVTSVSEDGVYTFARTGGLLDFNGRFAFVAGEGGNLYIDILNTSDEEVEAGEEQTVFEDSETGERFWIDGYGIGHYMLSADDTDHVAVAYRDTLGDPTDEIIEVGDDGTKYGTFRSGFYRFILEDGTERCFSFHIEDDSSVTFKEADIYANLHLMAPQPYMRRPATEVYLYDAGDGKYLLGYNIDGSFTLWAGTTTAVPDAAGEYTFVIQDDDIAATFEYYTGVETDGLRFRINADGTFAFYDGAYRATSNGSTLTADGYGILTLTTPTGTTTYPYARRDDDGSRATLAYSTFADPVTTESGLVLQQAQEYYAVIDLVNGTFELGSDRAGVYYAAILSGGGIGIAGYAFELDGAGHVILSEQNGTERRGTYEETGILANGATLLDQLGITDDLVLYTFTFQEGEETEHVNVAAFHSNELSYTMDGETFLFIPFGFFFQQLESNTVEIETEDGNGYITSYGYVSYNTITISDAAYFDGVNFYVGTVLRGRYENDSFYYSERDFIFDDGRPGNVFLFEAYDENNEISDQFFFDIVEKDGVEYASLRTTDSGLFVETVGGDIGSATLLLDGHGKGTLVRNGEQTVGTVTRDTESGASSYLFTSDDLTFGFGIFLMTTNSGVTVYSFAVSNGNATMDYINSDWSMLHLDDYLTGYYVDHNGVRTAGIYTLLGERRHYVSLLPETGNLIYFTLNDTEGTFAICEDEFIVEDGVLIGYQGSGAFDEIPDGITRITRSSFPFNTWIGPTDGNTAGTLNLNEVVHLDAHAFHYVNLAYVSVYGPNVTEIGEGALAIEFYDNYAPVTIYHAVSSVNFPKVVTIGAEAFRNATITNFKFGTTLASIGDHAFSMRQNITVTFDFTAFTADELKEIELGTGVFDGLAYGDYVEDADGNRLPVGTVILLADIPTLREFWIAENWPEAIRDTASLKSVGRDYLEGYDFYSFTAEQFLRFENGRITVGGIGREHPLTTFGMYIIQEEGAQPTAFRRSEDGTTTVDIALAYANDIVTMDGHEYLRVNAAMSSITAHKYPFDAGYGQVDFSFDFFGYFNIEGNFFEGYAVHAVYVGTPSDRSAIAPTSYSYADGKLTIEFTYEGDAARAGTYTVTVDFATNTATGVYRDLRWVYSGDLTGKGSYSREDFRVLAEYDGEGELVGIRTIAQGNYMPAEGYIPWDNLDVLACAKLSDGGWVAYVEGERQMGTFATGLYHLTFGTTYVTVKELSNDGQVSGMFTPVYTDPATPAADQPYTRFTFYVIPYADGTETKYLFLLHSAERFVGGSVIDRTFTETHTDNVFDITFNGKTYHITLVEEDGGWIFE